MYCVYNLSNIKKDKKDKMHKMKKKHDQCNKKYNMCKKYKRIRARLIEKEDNTYDK